MVAIAYNEFMNDLNAGPEMRNYIARHESILRIRQLQFTKICEEIGSQSPLWLSLDRTINSATEQSNGPCFTQVPERSCIEIYADSLFEKNFYNLFENAIRHGG